MGNVLNSLFGSDENNRTLQQAAYIYSQPTTNSYHQYHQQTTPVRVVAESWGGDGIVVTTDRGRSASYNYYGLITLVLSFPETRYWTLADYDLKPVHFVQVPGTSDEYKDIHVLFKKTNKKCFNVTNIERVQNPYIMCAFLLKQEELKNRLGYLPEVLDLYHGTQRSSVQSICENNFDWRRHGQHVGAKFGKGVSFSPFSNYATHYSDKGNIGKVMLLVKVLVGRKCVGQQDMTLPSPGCDTTEKVNGHVIVKYEDNEFYPAYKITYDYIPSLDYKNKVNRNVNMNFNYNY